jgi:hypothetical protein
MTEKKVEIDARQWVHVTRLVARMMISWRHVEREAELILAACRHAAGCPSTVDPCHTCLRDCPDRERWLSARVMLGNARAYVGELKLPATAAAAGQYIPPTREYLDRIVGELEAMRAARDWVAELEQHVPPSGRLDLVAAPREQPLTRLLPDDAYPAPGRAGPILDAEFEEEEESA